MYCKQDMRSQRRKKALEISHQWYQYKKQADDLMKFLDDIEKKMSVLSDPIDEHKLKVISFPIEYCICLWKQNMFFCCLARVININNSSSSLNVI